MSEELEDTVSVTYKEIFNRAADHLEELGISLWYVTKEGIVEESIDLTKSQALIFMEEEEFDCRKNK